MTGTWETTDLAGHAVDLFTPAAPWGGVAVLFLPDHGQRPAESSAFTAALERFAVPAVCPRGDGCWWLDLVEPAFDPERPPLRFLTDDVVPFVAERFGVVPPDVRLLGCGVGGQGGLQLAYRRPREFPVVAAIDPAVDFHELYGRGTVIDGLFPSREAARQQTATLRMQGIGWPRRQLLVADRASFWFDGADRLDMKLRSMMIPLETDFGRTAGGDRDAFFEDRVARAVEFLIAERPTLPVIARDR